MNSNSNHSNLFNDAGCLDKNTIQRYIEGKLSEEELAAVKGHARKCSLCKDALLGAKYFSNSRSYRNSLGRMNQSFFKRPNRTSFKAYRWSVNAMVLLAVIILIIGMYHILSTRPESSTPVNNYNAPAGIITDTLDSLNVSRKGVADQEKK